MTTRFLFNYNKRLSKQKYVYDILDHRFDKVQLIIV